MAKLPDFLIPGVARAGTTSLFYYLAHHPKIVQPKCAKELHFFDWQYDENRIWDYINAWPLCEHKDVLYFESSPDYIFEPKVPRRIQYWIPDCKFIVLLREPVQRAWSLWFNYYMKFYGVTLQELRELPTQITYDTKEASKNPINKFSKRRILQTGIYAKMLKRYFKYFPRTQFFIIDSDYFFAHPDEITNRCLQFLGLEEQSLDKYDVYDPLRHKGVTMPPMPEDIRQVFADFYKPYNEMLYELLDWDFGW